MKKKTIWSLVLALALVVSAISTATSAFAATPAPMEPVTKIATENEDAIWEQIEAVEEKRHTEQDSGLHRTFLLCTPSGNQNFVSATLKISSVLLIKA